MVLYGGITGILAKRRGKGGFQNKEFPPKKQVQRPDAPLVLTLGGCIAAGAVKSLQIGGYVLFVSLVSGVIASVLPLWLLENGAFKGLLYGFFEFSSGVFALEGNTVFKLFWGSFLICWSGLSVQMQVSGFLLEGGLSPKRQLCAHLLCAPVVATGTVLLSKIFGLI